MAERDFVDKLERAGFRAVEIVDRKPWGIHDCSMYPLFTAELIALMEQLIPAPGRDRIGDSIVIRAKLPSLDRT